MTRPTARLCIGLLLTAAAQAHAGVDAKLLDMLLANGSITKAQHAELSTELAREQRAERKLAKDNVSKKEFTELKQLAGWATTTKLTGDMRVREETIDIEEAPGTSFKDKDRQRIRARLGAFTQVNPQVEVGIQVATGSSNDQRSTNQDMDNYFTKKDLWLDLGYVDYHPVQVPGLKLFGGKMKQPWIAVADMAWDNDTNPEGFAAQYIKKMGTNTLTTSASYMVLKDNVDGEGIEWDHDLSLFELQGAFAFDVGSSTRLLFGATLNEFNNESQGFPPAPTVTLRANGNTTDLFRLVEGFAQLDVIGLPVPLSVYTQYIQNIESRDLVLRTSTSVTTLEDGDEDTAILLGFRTNIAGIAFDYNYRDVERNAVVGTLTDSDFSDGITGGAGHKLKAQYDFLKNFNLMVTYFKSESDTIVPGVDDGEFDRLQVDLNAKF